ncbi:MAG: DEAD/DEAH box helicase [Pseudomonadota bacterium]|nr:DEAD/DEAH box helicase [Pseudomonadota bacterium]
MASYEENQAFAHAHQAQEATETVANQAAEPNPFADLGLAPELLDAVRELGFTQPTDVQQRAIPLALGAGGDAPFNDLMVSSQTGSGKTAAFLLPVLHTLIGMQREAAAREQAAWQAKVDAALAAGEPPPKKPRRKNPLDARHFKPAVPGALVLCPTRELAQQVAQDAIDLVKHCRGLRIASVVGGMPYQLQIANLVVATPGRLLDLAGSGQIELDQVRFLVMDEADRMLDLGFADALAEVHQRTAQRQQTMMFSATFAPRIQQLAMRVMHEGGAKVRKVEVATPQQQHANIRQELYWADSPEHRRRLLDYWLRDPSIDQAIVFACTQIECEQLAEDLQQAGFAAVSLHGALSQAVRNRRLKALRDGRVQILVATDVAARGIDVPSITHVINHGLPMKAEDYTHRIGRTGRAGRDGLAITLAEFRDRKRLADIEAYTRQHFRPLTVQGLEPTRFFPPITQEPPARKGGRSPGRGGPARGGATWGGKPGGKGGARGFGEPRGPKLMGDGFQPKTRSKAHAERGDSYQKTSKRPLGSSHAARPARAPRAAAAGKPYAQR